MHAVSAICSGPEMSGCEYKAGGYWHERLVTVFIGVFVYVLQMLALTNIVPLLELLIVIQVMIYNV